MDGYPGNSAEQGGSRMPGRRLDQTAGFGGVTAAGRVGAAAGTAGRAAAAASATIQAKDLAKVYPGGKRALAGVSFSVERGEIFGFLGPNGSGKTTAVKIFVTLLRQTSGAARVGGFDTESQPAQVRRLVGYAGQLVGVDDDLTVAENLAFSGFLHGVRRNEAWQRAAELIKAFSLADVAGQRAARLSGGLRRRLDLAQALVHRPSVLFLDEPTTGLDLQSRRALWDRLRQLSGEGVTVFLTTQYLEEADRACDRVAILDQGQLVRVGTPAALKEEVGGGRLVVTISDPADRGRAADALASSESVVRVQQDGQPGGRLVVYVRDAPASVAAVIGLLAAERVRITGVEQAQASLDDVFLRYTGNRPRAEPRIQGAVSSMFAAAHGRRRH
jgi:ABC-2 type transport system ATP-binding protein